MQKKTRDKKPTRRSILDVSSSKIIDLEQEQDNSSQTVTPYSIVHVIQLKSELESSKKIINNLQLDVATLKGMIKNLRIRKSKDSEQ